MNTPNNFPKIEEGKSPRVGDINISFNELQRKSTSSTDINELENRYTKIKNSSIKTKNNTDELKTFCLSNIK